MDLDFRAKLKDSVKHFQTGLAYMLPFLSIGALGRVIPVLLGQRNVAEMPPLFAAMYQAGNVGFDLFIPIMAGYISYAIADTPGLAPGVIVGVLARAGGSGYLGGLLGGFVAGYMTYAIMGLSKQLPDVLRTSWDRLAPGLGALVVSIFINLIVNPPVKTVMDATTAWLNTMGTGSYALLGTVMGGIPGVDFGGPLSQAKFMFALGSFERGVLVPMAIAGASSSVPPIGMCLATFLAPRLYDERLRSYGQTSMLYALIGGWTEIGIPFVVDDWLRVTVACIVGSAVAGAIAGAIALKVQMPMLGVLGIVLYDKWWGYLLAMGVGSVVTALLANLLKSRAKTNLAPSDQTS